MRIIAGRHKGRKIIPPTGDGIRPTSSKMREAMFNILLSGGYITPGETKVVDLCCGTGSLGLEALSRGAALVVFIDGSKEHLRLASQNIINFDEVDKAIVIRANAETLLKAQDRFDLVFIDPPYFKKIANRALEALYDKEWLNSKAAIIVELAKLENLTFDPNKYQQITTRIYGNSKFILLERL